MCHQRILLPLNFLYLRLTCTLPNADPVSWQMVFFTVTALAAFRVSHSSFPLDKHLLLCLLRAYGRKLNRYWNYYFQWSHVLAQCHGCCYPPCLFGLDCMERLGAFSSFRPTFLIVCPFPMPFPLLLLATWLCGPFPSFTTAVQGCSLVSGGCSAILGDCSAHFACSSDNCVVRVLTVSCSAIMALLYLLLYHTARI